MYCCLKYSCIVLWQTRTHVHRQSSTMVHRTRLFLPMVQRFYHAMLVENLLQTSSGWRVGRPLTHVTSELTSSSLELWNYQVWHLTGFIKWQIYQKLLCIVVKLFKRNTWDLWKCEKVSFVVHVSPRKSSTAATNDRLIQWLASSNHSFYSP